MTAEPVQPSATPRWARVALVLLTLLALVARLAAVDFGLPSVQGDDTHLARSIEHVRGQADRGFGLSQPAIYPHLLTRLALLLGDPKSDWEAASQLSLEDNLRQAASVDLQVRRLVACLSVLVIPASFWLARRFFSPGWSLLAAALVASSLLGQWLAAMARPHAPAAALVALALVSLSRLVERGRRRDWALAALAVGLAAATLQSALGLGFAALAAAIFALRRSPRKAWVGVPLALGCLYLCAWIGYPFALSGGGAFSETESDRLDFGSQHLWLGDFRGGGFVVVAETLWFYEPVATVLALIGLCACLPKMRAALRSNPVVVVLVAYALPYLLVLGLFDLTMQRFVLPLVPLLALLAAAGARDVARRLVGLESWPRCALLAGIALVVPFAASCRLALLRAKPSTLELATQALSANADSQRDVIALFTPFDLPLVRRRENLFTTEGQFKQPIFSPWINYQLRWGDQEHASSWPGTRWNVINLGVAGNGTTQELELDPGGLLRRTGATLVVVPGGDQVQHAPAIAALQQALAASGELIFHVPADPRPVRPKPRYGLKTHHFTWLMLTEECFGGSVEVWRLRP